mmetsp:Transcript_23090/g.34435  ORF Transcript_23090/g.34435 Transcript_23090/m.34435 type:complete len:523 (-) Transcript_23090:212-1780(-)
MEGNDDSPVATFVNCNGLRYAVPYDSTTKPMYIKDKFVGQTLDLVLGQMFRRHRGTQPIEEAAAHWLKEIKAGRVEIRHRKTSRDDPWEWHVVSDRYDQDQAAAALVVCKGDSIRLRQHIHEKVVPASASNIKILFENEKWIAISKPGGLATLDEYGKGVNSLLTLVEEEILSRQQTFNLQNDKRIVGAGNKADKVTQKLNLQLAHRLDKPVSGVLFMGKSPGKAASLLREIQSASATKGEPGGAQKVYVARVRRNPESVALVNAPEVLVVDEFPEQATVEIELGWDNDNKRAVAMLSDTEAFATQLLARKQSQEGQDRKERWKDKNRQKYTSCKEKDEEKEQIISSPVNKKRKSDAATSTTPVHTTRFRRLSKTQQIDGTFLVECMPLSGQRHQIRAHLAAIGWPIANDTVYIGEASETACEKTNKLLAYVDDDAGTLKQLLGSPRVFRPWCTKCKWTMQMLSASSAKSPLEEDKQEEDDEVNNLRQLEVEGEIWLHSMRYILPKAGLDITAPLPEWAQPL